MAEELAAGAAAAAAEVLQVGGLRSVAVVGLLEAIDGEGERGDFLKAATGGHLITICIGGGLSGLAFADVDSGVAGHPSAVDSCECASGVFRAAPLQDLWGRGH